MRSSACASSRRRTIRGTSQAPQLRGALPPEIPDHVDDPAVAKASGVVTSPRHIKWSRPDPTYDLSDRGQRIRVYEQVLREGTAADVRYVIDVDEVIDLWDEMVLPRAVSEAWIRWLAHHRNVTVRDCRDRARDHVGRSVPLTGATAARRVAREPACPRPRDSCSPTVAAMAAHWRAGPHHARSGQHRRSRADSGGPSLAAAIAEAAAASGLDVRRDRQWEAFVRLRLGRCQR